MPRYEEQYSLISWDLYIPSMKTRYPLITSFASEPVKIFSPSNEDVYLAKAGIDSLKPFLDSTIDLQKNYDLVGVAFNAFVVNRANKNDQVISTETALSMVENFKFKPLNIEHKRKDVVGLITGFGFSEFGSDKPLTLDEVKDKKDPFNVVLSGFVWRVVDSEFAENLEDSADPSSLKYLSISTSWELGFKNFSIAKGGKNLNEAEILTDDSLIASLKDKLAHFGGEGVDDNGNRLYLNIVGEVLPLGVGFTQRPAADVKGVKVAQPFIEKSETSKAEINSNKIQSSQDNETNVIVNNELKEVEKIAASSIKDNKTNKSKNMIIRSINDLTEESLKQVTATEIRDLLQDEIKKASEKFIEENKQKELEASEKESVKQDLETRLAEVTELKEKFEAELNNLKAEMAQKEKEESFQARMTSLDEEFNLEDEDRQAIGEQIRDLDQEGFEKWYKAFSIFAKSKNKKMLEKNNKHEEPKENKESKASDIENEADKKYESQEEKESKAVAALEEAKANKSDALPNVAENTLSASLKEKYAKAFNSQTIKIDTSKF